MPPRFAFLPHARTQVLSRSRGVGASGRRHIDLDVEVRGDGVAEGARIAITGDLRGPGDIVTVERAMIARVEPIPGLAGFEPNYMPFVEFVDADFPWRFTLDTGAAQGIGPWIVLIALDAEEFVRFLLKGTARGKDVWSEEELDAFTEPLREQARAEATVQL